MKEPQDYPRRILLCVPGYSPQVVTLALYALSIASDPVFVPTEIHAITTAEGAERLNLGLLQLEEGQFFRLCKDYNIDPNSIIFDQSTVHVVTDSEGRPLKDVRTSDDNSAVADSIMEVVRELANDPDCAIHASIAGGRKTVGFYVGYALSLFGRPQDRLSHVLVSAPFEAHWEFWYPPPKEKVIFAPDNRLYSTKDARISLAYIPFVRLRDNFQDLNPKPKIFISYSRKDETNAKNLFDNLKQKGYLPWMDKENLLPGQDWESEIQRAIRGSDFVVLLLSKNSIDKRGFFQTELKLTLDVLDTIPQGEIFAIPLRLDECRIPDRLAAIHWVDLFYDYNAGFRKLLRAIDSRNKQTEFSV